MNRTSSFTAVAAAVMLASGGALAAGASGTSASGTSASGSQATATGSGTIIRSSQAGHQLRGEIINMKDVKIRGRDGTSQVVMIRTESGSRAVVDLGDRTKLSDLGLKAGQNVTVSGNFRRVGDRLVLFADRVNVNNKDMRIDRQAMRQSATTGGQSAGAAAASMPSDYVQVKGVIMQTKPVGIIAERKNTVALIKTGDNRYVVADLGDSERLGADRLRPGQEVMIRGREGRVGDRIIVVGDSLRSGEETMDLDRSARSGTGRNEASLLMQHPTGLGAGQGRGSGPAGGSAAN